MNTLGAYRRLSSFVYSLSFHTLNIKSLAISAVIALSSLTGVAAEAAPTKCALRNSNTRELVTFTCDHSMRHNANGHKVNDITFFNGDNRYDISIIYWLQNDGRQIEYAEVWMNGKRTVMNGYIAKNGSWCASNAGFQFCVH